MKYALISDIHANLPALDAVLADIEAVGVDATYHLGDLVGYGPWPNETVARLVERAIANAEAKGFAALYLLTTTAESYFPSFGFSRVSRDVVPDAVKATEEFTSACPSSAAVMTLELDHASAA